MIIVKLPPGIRLVVGHDYGVEDDYGVIIATFRHQRDAEQCKSTLEANHPNPAEPRQSLTEDDDAKSEQTDEPQRPDPDQQVQ